MTNWNIFYAKQLLEFKKITGIEIRGHNIFGIDCDDVDKQLKTPENTSTMEWVKKQYGDRAGELLHELCGVENLK